MKTRFKFLLLLIVLLLSIPAHAKWRYEEKIDRMSGEVSISAISRLTPPEELPRYPYHELKASFQYRCDTEKESAFIVFNEKLPLDNLQRDDYGVWFVETRINFDNDRFTELLLTQPFAHGIAFYHNSQEYIRRIKHSSSALLEVVIKGIPPVYFTFDLEGAGAAITQAKQNCKL